MKKLVVETTLMSMFVAGILLLLNTVLVNSEHEVVLTFGVWFLVFLLAVLFISGCLCWVWNFSENLGAILAKRRLARDMELFMVKVARNDARYRGIVRDNYMQIWTNSPWKDGRI